ncbi:MAG: Asp/Glu/hydantoin racemase [Anaerolineales bacterium]|nr:Asp/Glu/hydantoin racemase [Anaerolineales bacterium]
MTKRVVLLHTVPPLIEVFRGLSTLHLPDVQVFHILDEPLLEHVRQQGGIGGGDIVRIASHVEEATAIGAQALLVTCSTVSPGVDSVRAQARIPVLKIDEAMIAKAVQLGDRIGVVATNRTTLAPTELRLRQVAAAAGTPIDVSALLVEGALPALLHGDAQLHDQLVAAGVQALAPTVDVIVLAQASMARLLDVLLPAALSVPVLASPQLALAQLAAMLNDE